MREQKCNLNNKTPFRFYPFSIFSNHSFYPRAAIYCSWRLTIRSCKVWIVYTETLKRWSARRNTFAGDKYCRKKKRHKRGLLFPRNRPALAGNYFTSGKGGGDSQPTVLRRATRARSRCDRRGQLCAIFTPLSRFEARPRFGAAAASLCLAVLNGKACLLPISEKELCVNFFEDVQTFKKF